jgi:hypothetical protein
LKEINQVIVPVWAFGVAVEVWVVMTRIEHEPTGAHAGRRERHENSQEQTKRQKQAGHIGEIIARYANSHSWQSKGVSG